MKRKHLLLLVTLAAAMLLLSACGVPREGVDVTEVPPSGLWQVLVVWPLARGLVWLNDILSGFNTPYSWGFAIVFFTLIIKLVTFPLTMTQIRGMQAQKDLQPKLQELQKKHGKNREKLAAEQMKLYQEAGVNPLSGCLPLVVQMPILFGLYSALVALAPQLASSDFFWIPDLSFPEFTVGLAWIPELFNNGEYMRLASYLVLPVLLMVSQVFMQRMTTPSVTPGAGGGQAGMMKQMSTVMSLMFGFFTLQVPAGLTLYWVTSNLLQMGQTGLVNSLHKNNNSAGSETVGNGSGASEDTKLEAETVPAVAGVSSSSSKPVAKRRKNRRRKRK